MRIGDTIEAAAWLTGTESEGVRKHYETDVCGAMDTLCAQLGFERGPARFSELQPEDDRVPEVPDHVTGPDVRLLVAEADVIAPAPVIEQRSFLGELDRKDLERLRKIVRREYATRHPGARLTDLEADDVIEEVGPEAALDALRRAVQTN